MAALPTKQYGVTPPISTLLPTDSELAANEALVAELKKQNNYEGIDETEKRCVATISHGHMLADALAAENLLYTSYRRSPLNS